MTKSWTDELEDIICYEFCCYGDGKGETQEKQIKSFISNLLDKQRDEIAIMLDDMKRHGVYVIPGKPDEEAFIEWNEALQQAITKIKGE